MFLNTYYTLNKVSKWHVRRHWFIKKISGQVGNRSLCFTQIHSVYDTQPEWDFTTCFLNPVINNNKYELGLRLFCTSLRIVFSCLLILLPSGCQRLMAIY